MAKQSNGLTVELLISRAKKASEPRKRWWKSIEALVESQLLDPHWLQTQPLMFAEFWTWVVDMSNRDFVPGYDATSFSRICKDLLLNPATAIKDGREDPDWVPIGAYTSVCVIPQAGVIIRKFIAVTERNND